MVNAINPDPENIIYRHKGFAGRYQITMDKKILFTKEGLEEIKKEYEDLVNVQRPAILEELQNARALGDLSENGMYSAAREKQSFIEGRIREIEDIMKKAEVVEESEVGQKTIVDLGANVTLETQQQKVVYSVVGAEEVDFDKNRISHESPLGKALIGKKVGDIVEVNAPAGVVQYKIVSIQ